MYKPYPSGSQMPEEPQRPAAPAPLLMAVRLMYVGAALSVVELIVGLATLGSLKAAILKDHPGYTNAQLNDAKASLLAATVLFGVVAVGLWIWMARANGAGKGWARIVASILFVLGTLDLFGEGAQAHAAVSLVFGLLVWIAGLGAIILIWRGDSRRYFAAVSGKDAPG
jgi:hypothetical protein